MRRKIIKHTKWESESSTFGLLKASWLTDWWNACCVQLTWCAGGQNCMYTCNTRETQFTLNTQNSKALFWHCLICGSGLFLKYISTYSRLKHFLEYPNLSLGDRREQLLSSGSATFFPYYVWTNINVGILVCKGDDGRIDNRTHVLHKAAIGVSIAVN